MSETVTVMIPDQLWTPYYTNWEDVTEQRKLIPTGKIRFGSSKWHPREQWLIECLDADSGEIKEFALDNFKGTQYAEGAQS